MFFAPFARSVKKLLWRKIRWWKTAFSHSTFNSPYSTTKRDFNTKKRLQFSNFPFIL